MKHLPSTEPDPHVVRIGWSLDSCSTQLGKEGNQAGQRRVIASVPGVSSFLSFSSSTGLGTEVAWDGIDAKIRYMPHSPSSDKQDSARQIKVNFSMKNLSIF